uniref:Uncharacterized protein n=1 Tax=Neogobius melanostomus TaxID=47308 RepID=A0A8C6USK8_9GOBI
MVTDNALYIGNHNWAGSDFAINVGVGLVLMLQNNLKNRARTILGQVRAAFDRDWRSLYKYCDSQLHTSGCMYNKM